MHHPTQSPDHPADWLKASAALRMPRIPACLACSGAAAPRLLRTAFMPESCAPPPKPCLQEPVESFSDLYLDAAQVLMDVGQPDKALPFLA